MMKKLIILILLLLTSSLISAQEIIENPKKPLNKNAGQIVQLEEVMRIRDNGNKVIFRGPYDLKIGPDNGIYFYDNWMLHKFDEKGRFVFKIVQQGQGPAEANNRTYYFFFNDEIQVYAKSPPKIMRFNILVNTWEKKEQRKLECIILWPLKTIKFMASWTRSKKWKMLEQDILIFPITSMKYQKILINVQKNILFHLKIMCIVQVRGGREQISSILLRTTQQSM